MDINDRFATRAIRVDETPEPFRGALRQRLSPQDAIHLLAFNPTHTSQGVRSPATLLALTDRRWLLIYDDADGRASVIECGFEDTLLVELTEILPYGQLKIDSEAGGSAQASVLEFDTVTDTLYREAVRLILRGVEGGSSSDSGGLRVTPSLVSWPIHFRNAVPETPPERHRPLAAAHWPAVHDGFRRELAPAAALLTTDREPVP